MIRVPVVLSLVGFVGLLVGCGGGANSTAPEVPTPVKVTPPPGDPSTSGPVGQEADLYEIDPAKHILPQTPARGRLRGKPFTPDRVELEGKRLSFRQGKDFFADLELSLQLNDKKDLTDGLKQIVRTSQKWSDGIPSLQVSSREGKNLPDTKFISDDYALTLELGKATKGKIPGSIYICLPDSHRSYLVGTFVAQRKRTLYEPPGEDDVPFIQGTITPPAKKDQTVWVGYVGQLADGKVISDSAGSTAFDTGGGGVRSQTYAPRMAGLRFEKHVAKFDFVNLPPGRYLVHARLSDGPAGWVWANVAAGDRITTDLKLEAFKLGTVEVKVPTRVNEVRLVPTDLGTPPPDANFLRTLANTLDLKGKAMDGVAKITNVPVGKYQVRAGDLQADIEVVVDETVKVELTPAKK
ncbi:MAG: hypothetical protein C0467_15435 [Planctomycetaceae bacterium]|nr:hypothetical protein [Planctomycetaceae bacterium]